MAKTDFTSAEAFFASLPAVDAAVLRQIRQAILEAVPDAEEVISYQLPAYRRQGFLFYLSSAKNHYGLSCPPPFTVFEAFAEELQPFGRSKSTIRFPKELPVPYDLIGRMARFRADENAHRETGKVAAKRGGGRGGSSSPASP